jgi:hypothetical protein
MLVCLNLCPRLRPLKRSTLTLTALSWLAANFDRLRPGCQQSRTHCLKIYLLICRCHARNCRRASSHRANERPDARVQVTVPDRIESSTQRAAKGLCLHEAQGRNGHLGPTRPRGASGHDPFIPPCPIQREGRPSLVDQPAGGPKHRAGMWLWSPGGWYCQLRVFGKVQMGLATALNAGWEPSYRQMRLSDSGKVGLE